MGWATSSFSPVFRRPILRRPTRGVRSIWRWKTGETVRAGAVGWRMRGGRDAMTASGEPHDQQPAHRVHRATEREVRRRARADGGAVPPVEPDRLLPPGDPLARDDRRSDRPDRGALRPAVRLRRAVRLHRRRGPGPQRRRPRGRGLQGCARRSPRGGTPLRRGGQRWDGLHRRRGLTRVRFQRPGRQPPRCRAGARRERGR